VHKFEIGSGVFAAVSSSREQNGVEVVLGEGGAENSEVVFEVYPGFVRPLLIDVENLRGAYRALPRHLEETSVVHDLQKVSLYSTAGDGRLRLILGPVTEVVARSSACFPPSHVRVVRAVD